jgi:cell division protease FtsH
LRKPGPPNMPPHMRNFTRSLFMWILVAIVMIVAFNLFNAPHQVVEEVSYSQFLDLLEKGIVKRAVIGEHELTAELEGKGFREFQKEMGIKKPPTPFWKRAIREERVKKGPMPSTVRIRVNIPAEYGDLIKNLRAHHVEIYVKPPEKTPWYVSLLGSWLPFILLIAIWIFFMRQMQVGGGKALSFGKSKARLMTDQGKKVTFADVAGIEEAKEEVQEIIEFLKDPKKFQRLGGKIPKGVLLVGPPGTGKTLLAKAIAGEAGVPFFSISGSEFVEMFVGVGAARVRDLFEQAKSHAPCIIFVDEIDAVGRHRGAGLGGGHDEREQTLNQLLVEMDGMDTSEGIIMVAATNRPDILDPALLRPGRFDRRVVIPRPDVKGREEVLKVHVKGKPLADAVDLSVIAKSTPGFSGADLANLVNEAALLAARKERDGIIMEDFEEAKDKILMGVERKSMIISDEEKRNTAYHEAGHALVAKLIPGTDPVHKVTIIPRGLALGLTQQLPTDDRYTYTKKQLMKNITVLLGGRAAEEVVLHHQTTGAANDLERATAVARKMVCQFGMSDRLGPLTFGKKDELVFLGKELAAHKEYSERTAEEIDGEVTKIVRECYQEAKELLTDNPEALEALANTLLEKEVLSSDELEKILSQFDLKRSTRFETAGAVAGTG